MFDNVFVNSKWIWNSHENTENEYNEFLETVECNGENIKVRISVCGDYTLFVNGKYAESNQYGDFEHYKVYDEIDITKYTVKGENRICILAWYIGKAAQRYFTPHAGLIYEVLKDGKVVSVSSEKTLSRKSVSYTNGGNKKITGQLGYSFTYDMTKEDAWLTKDTDGFVSSCEVNGAKEFFARPTEKLKLGKLFTGNPVKKEGKYLIDLGEEVVGIARLCLTSEKYQKINVSYGELLEDGHVKRIIDGRDFSFDFYAKEGKNEYTNYMLRLACRYIEIECEHYIDIEYVGITEQYYPVKETAFLPKDELDRRIYKACVNTLKKCMMEHYVDCPWREQCLYAFDSRNQILAGFTAFENGNRRYARANLLLLGKDRREDKILAICAPCGTDLTIPSFSFYYILAVKEYMENTGDNSLGEEVFEKLGIILGAFAENMTDGLVNKMQSENHWNFYDWSDYAVNPVFGAKENETDLLINCIALIGLDSYEKICKMLSRENRFSHLSEGIKAEAKKRFFNSKTGLFFVSNPDEKPTELVNSLAVLCGLCDVDTAVKICEKLALGELGECSLSMKSFKYDAMLSVDKEKYKDAVLSEIRSTYKVMLDEGSTTVWETAKGAEDFGGAGSLCHGWSAIPVYYYKLFEN